MLRARILVTALTTVTMTAVAPLASADDQYTFPSISSATINANAPATFVAPSANVGTPGAAPSFRFGSPAENAKGAEVAPIALADAAYYAERFGGRAGNTDAYGFRFATHALGYAGFANYANDYYRLFTPGFAVSQWTDRVAGFVDIGYGGAVDGWTAATYYMPRLRGRHRESSPDLSLMPTFRAHPELQQNPTFTQPN